jgi:hypothetical protein
MKINDRYKNPYLLAELFHNTYESLAPKYGYETKEETKEFSEHTPNGKLMIETCHQILKEITK